MPSRRLFPLLLVSLLSVPVPGSGQAARVFAGFAVDGYEDSETWVTLENSTASLELIRGTLTQDFGFLSPEEVVLTGSEATRDEVWSLVTTLQDQLQPEDNLVFYFAGHGADFDLEVAGQRVGSESYLAAWDSGERERAQARSLLLVEDLLEELARVPARHVLVILDLGYRGLSLESVRKDRPDRGASPSDAERVSRTVWASAGDGELAAEGGPEFPGVSLFAGALARVLENVTELDDDADGLVHTRTIAAEVQNLLQAGGMEQTLLSGQFELDQRGALLLPTPPNPVATLYRQTLDAYEGGDMDAFATGAEELADLAPGSGEQLHTTYLLAMERDDVGGALSAVRGLLELMDEDALGPSVQVSRTQLRAAQRSLERRCEREGCGG